MKHFCRKTVITGIVLSLVVSPLIGQYFELYPATNIDSFNCSCDLGRGLGFVDIDNDYVPDLNIATALGDSNAIYHCQDGNFYRAQTPSDDQVNSYMLLWVDLDNDGDRDLVEANYGLANRLFENDGNGNLTDISAGSGILDDGDQSRSVTAGDINKDGFLDLFVSNYSDSTYGNLLYINNGDLTFTEMAEDYGLPTFTYPTFIAVFVDFDKDGWQDLYMINDRGAYPNLMFKNIDGTMLEDVSESSNTKLYIDAMNGGIGDFNEDGFMDIYVTNGPPGNVLLVNNGDFTFTDMTDSMGVGFYRVGWGGTFRDIDNDSDLDLHVVGSFGTAADPNALYINQGEASGFIFNEHNIVGDTASTFVNAFADFNMDGKLDFALSNGNGIPHEIYMNVTDNDHHWVKLNLKGRTSNRDGVGAQTTVWRGDRDLHNYALAGESYLAQHSFLQHFGLEVDTVVETLTVLWPSGIKDTFHNLAADQIHSIIENSSNIDPLEITGQLISVAGSGIEDISIVVSGESSAETESDNDGTYAVEVTEFASVNIKPEMHTNWSEHVSVSDLVAIQRHILIIDTLDSPYKIIAADANNDGTVSVADLNGLLQIVTGNWTEINGNTSYRFVPYDHVFQDPMDPLSEAFPESVDIQDLTDDPAIDFYAIKVGNVFSE